MSTNEVRNNQEVLPDIYAGKSGAILAKLLRTLMVNTGLTMERYRYFMSMFVYEHQVDSSHKVTSLINGLSKEITNDDLTWKTWLKSLILLRMEKLTIYMIVDDKSVEHDIDLTNTALYEELFSFLGVSTEEKEVLANRELKIFLEKVIEALVPDHQERNYVQEYISKPGTSVSLRGNTSKELKRDSLTWKVFIKALIIYNLTESTLGVKVTNKAKNTYTSSVKMLLNSDMEEEE